MANVNIRTPIFYPDLINFLLSRGTALTEFSIQSGTDLIVAQSGSVAELFDMRPLNQVSFDTSADTDGHVLLNMDFQGSYAKTFIAILNHNMKTANASLRVGYHGSSVSGITTADFGGGHALLGSAGTVTEVVNADDLGGSSPYLITPAADGHTLFTFTPRDERYLGLQFEGANGNFSSTDLSIGCIIVGEHYTMPHAPELSIKRTIAFDKVRQIESLGGQKFSNMVSFGKLGSSTSKSPFSLANNGRTLYGGRMSYNMKFNYLASTDVMPNEYSRDQQSDDAVIEDVWNKTNGSHIPFIFSIDSESLGDEAESEHIFARFGQNSLDMTQVAPDVFNISMRIEEEF
tara:strand:+ start:3096 stop:4133 length:1038 start_codon:yes stop_codon:yes gene_type:complete